jgi:hypothetical protein
VFIRAAAGTTYTAGVHTFSGLNGIIFNLTENVTIGSIGFAYAPVSSQLSGSQTNIQAATINKVTPEPVGHIYTTNTFAAFGGRDNESDQDFQNRIIQGINALARGTLPSLEQAFVKINPNVLSLRYNGIDNTGKNVIVVVPNNGVDFSTNDFDEIFTKTKSFFNLSDLGYNGVSGLDNTLIKLVNVDWYYLNLLFRIELEVGASADDVRVLIQQQIQQYLDYRYFPDNGRIEWDDLLVIVRQTTGVRYVFDEYFFLNGTRNDVIVPSGYLPRILNFSMLDAQGFVISDSLGILNPYYLPNPSDLNYLNNVIRGIV